MIRAGSWRSRSHIANCTTAVLRLYRSVWQFSVGGNPFLQFTCRAGNVESHPVKYIFGLLLDGDVRIVENQSEADGALRYVAPYEPRRHCARPGDLCVFVGNDAAVFERSRGER